MQRFLLIKLRNIGDVLLTAPAIRALRETHPDAYVAALVNAGTEEMLTGNPDLDRIFVLPGRKNRSLSSNMSLVNSLRKARFDAVVNMTEGDRGAILAFLSGARVRAGIDPKGKGFFGKKYFYTHIEPPQSCDQHTVEFHLSLTRSLGVNMETAPPLRIAFGEEDIAAARAALADVGVDIDKPFAHVHPASRWLFKCWPEEKTAATIDWMQAEHGYPTAVTSDGSGKEKARLKIIRDNMRTEPRLIQGKLTLKGLAALSSKASFFLGVDTAPMHIAAAVNTPVVAVFGPSRHTQWRPWSVRHRVVKMDFPCRPCCRDGCDGTKISRCLVELPEERVREAILELLREKHQ